MDKGLRPIPALYACYLLRSTVRHASLYIGSTPDPGRRLRQHNREIKGGAARTSRDTLRPWEMSCLVTGFPSKIAALQFEWAWQNPHLTRHILADSRITEMKLKVPRLTKSGRVRTRIAKPRVSLTERLANLQLLLQAKSFSRWPLRVTFFADDVHRMWLRWAKLSPPEFQEHIMIGTPSKAGLHDATLLAESESVSTANVSTDYTRFKSAVEKRRRLFESPSPRCSICKEHLASNGSNAVLCSSDRCDMTAHVHCLATHIIGQESDVLLPTAGHCPSCDSAVTWIDTVIELTLHMRGQADIRALLKPPGRRKVKATEVVHDDVPSSNDDDLPMEPEIDDLDIHPKPDLILRSDTPEPSHGSLYSKTTPSRPKHQFISLSSDSIAP